MKKYYFTLLFACAASGAVLAQRGFTPAKMPQQAKAEQLLLALPSPENFRRYLTALTSVPHVAGSTANANVRDYLVTEMSKAGWQVAQYPYDIYMSKEPGENLVEVVTPVRLTLTTRENAVEGDAYSRDDRVTSGWNAYSGSGDVTAPVVYANYGTREDFARLAELGVSVRGKVVLARYGGNFRGYKAKYAQAAGAVGLVIYTDPADDGYVRGLTYPEGRYANESYVQRGSLLTLNYSGDPLTPFEPALPRDGKKKINRLDPAAVDLPNIPVTPIGYGAAKEILSRMTGSVAVPTGWQGGLPFTYRLEGGPALTVRVKVTQKRDFERVANVVGTLVGSEYPDEWILLGCHYDAWTFGTTDPNSGTAMLLDLAASLGKLAQQGYRPKRTIKIAHWDCEEHSLHGSSEWVEQLREELTAKAVAYVNADAACAGLSFNAASSPSLKQLLVEVAQAVPYPGADSTVYNNWLRNTKGTTEPNVGNLGGGSDHVGLYMHVGVPSANVGMGGSTPYHSLYDDLAWYQKFGDPDFVSGPTVARFLGLFALRMANADALPYDLPRYATDLKTHVEAAEKKIKEFSPGYSAATLLQAVAELKLTADALDQKLRATLQRGPLPKATEKAVNQALIGLEKAFIAPQGMAYGAWYRSLYASLDPFSGYGAWVLPAYQYAIATKTAATLDVLKTQHRQAIQNLRERMNRIDQQLTP